MQASVRRQKCLVLVSLLAGVGCGPGTDRAVYDDAPRESGENAGLNTEAEADTGAVTLIQRFGSAANLNIHLHCLVLDGVYRTTEGMPVFHAVSAPTAAELTQPDHKAPHAAIDTQRLSH